MLQRLNQFPEDLEDFFQQMIESIPALYRRQAVRTFVITMSAPGPLLLTLHSFLDCIEDDPEFFLKRTEKLGDTELLRLHERMRRQLEGRTKGLLEVVSGLASEHPYYRFTVDFLHRTVKDFLQSSSKVQSFMTDGQKEASEVWVLLCQGVLFEVKHSPFPEIHPHHPMLVFMCSAAKALQDPSNDSVIIPVFKDLEHCVATTFHLQADLELQQLVCQHGILSLLRSMCYDWPNISDPFPESQPLLRTALIDFEGGGPQQFNIVTYLLENGAQPNQRWGGLSHFQAYLEEACISEHLEEGDSHCFQIVAALVAHGADLSVMVTSDRGSLAHGIPAPVFISKVFPPELAAIILEGSPSRKAAQGQPSTSGRKTQVASRRAAVRSWFRQRLGRKNA